MERGWEICERKHCSSLSHICNHFQSIYTRTYLFRLCQGQIYLNNSNPFLFDYLLKSILTVIPLTKAQFFYPFFTNLSYEACWAWIHSSHRNSVQTQSLHFKNKNDIHFCCHFIFWNNEIQNKTITFLPIIKCITIIIIKKRKKRRLKVNFILLFSLLFCCCLLLKLCVPLSIIHVTFSFNIF